MFRNRLYYDIKPVVPLPIRQAVRRWLALRTRRNLSGSWPILPGSEKSPAGWPGWPDGKKFALILTHDVEGEAGLDRCRKLMQMEERLGFRSSFNFIPEGEYQVSRGFRDELTGQGFEVGVHDLCHNGKLYRNREGFAEQANRINSYIEEWGAAGFRSGFMLHNLKWLQDLDIQYDSSTFDTDPFEPQPDGVNTIFPFWVEGPGGRGYVEMPYTLAQDSTLFILLRERTINLWVKKLEWIVAQGGMALVNVHPDYIQFPGERPRRNSYPAHLYEDLLRHLSEHYQGMYWNALPKEAATFVRSSDAVASMSPLASTAESGSIAQGINPGPRVGLRGRAAVLLCAPYGVDTHQARESEALAKAGMEVDVFCLREKGGSAHACLNGVNVFRIGLAGEHDNSLISSLNKGWFVLVSFTILAWRSLTRQYKLVHIHHNKAGALVFAALPAKLRGAKMVLDLHDAAPEPVESNPLADAREDHGHSLGGMERFAIALSDLVLVSKSIFQRISRFGGWPAEKSVLNSPNNQASTSWPGERGLFLSRVENLIEPPTQRERKALRVCMVCYSYYETDNRVIRYAEELAQRGDDVEVLALRRSEDQPRSETIDGVRVIRLQDRLTKNQQTEAAYFWPILRFCWHAFFHLARKQFHSGYDLIHVHNVPDFLVFTTWFNKLFGTKVILDIHDIVPEFYASKFGRKDSDAPVRVLKGIEKSATWFSDHVIISNHLWREKFAVRTGAGGKCSVFINNVNSRIFHARERESNGGKFIILFPGGLQWHQGVDIALRAFHKISPSAPQAEFHIYGDGNIKGSLVTLARDLSLGEKVRFFDPLPVRQIADIMAKADLGVVPKRADSFGNEAYSTKIMEFMSLGVPVIVSETKIDRFYFNDSIVRFFASGNDEALAEAMLEMISNGAQRQEMAERASEYAEQNSWDKNKARYLLLIDRMCGTLGRNRVVRPPSDVLAHAS